MKKCILLVLLIPIIVFAEQRTIIETQGVTHLCVQTLNTYGVFYADNLRERHQQTLQFLRNNPCDINLLQEVVDEGHYNNFLSLSSELNMTGAYFGRLDDTKRSGLAGVFRGDLVDMDIQYFPAFQNDVINFVYESFQSVDKGFGVAYFQHSNSQESALLVLNLHLDHLSQQIRVSQILFILKWMLERQSHGWDIPFIMGGDLNFPRDSLEFDMMKYLLRFQDPYEMIDKEPVCTHWCEDSNYDILSALFGGQVRDYILFKPSSEARIQPVDINVFPKKHNGMHLSDHYGVRATFSFVPASRNSQKDSLEEKVADFRGVLRDVELVIEDSSEMQFIRSLDRGLDHAYSDITEYLRLN